jgi:hypothetical protein
VRKHRRLMSLLRNQEIAQPPAMGAQWGTYHHLFKAVIRNLHRIRLVKESRGRLWRPPKRQSHHAGAGADAAPSPARLSSSPSECFCTAGRARVIYCNAQEESYLGGWAGGDWVGAESVRGAGATGAAGGVVGTGARIP